MTEIMHNSRDAHERLFQGERVVLAFVGCVVPDEPRYHNAAFSRAGQIYQQELLWGLKRAGLPPSVILSAVPIPSYPKNRRFWIRGGEECLPSGFKVTLLPCLNLTPLKQITLGLSGLLQLLKWGWRNRRETRRVVYTYNLTVPPGLFTLLGARLIGAKAVVSLCDIDVPAHTVPNGLAFRLDYWLQRRLIPRFDGHVVAADAIARDFLPNRPYVRVEGGVNQEVSDLRDASREIQRGTEAPFVIAAAGRIDETNGFPVILKAFSLLEGDRYRLRIAGGGPLAQQIREAAANDRRIDYLGLVPFAQALELYRSASVLINMRMTTMRHTEYCFPSKMMEYLASGTPVITTCTGHAEIEFGSFAYLLRKETPEDLAEMIRYVVEQDPGARKELGQRARAYMAAHKTWEVQTRKVAQFIEQTVLGIGPKRQGGGDSCPIDSARHELAQPTTRTF